MNILDKIHDSCAYVMKNSKYIIYVSCDMHTLKRDLIDLNENYKTNSINLVDMFRGTYHCESICLLERK